MSGAEGGEPAKGRGWWGFVSDLQKAATEAAEEISRNAVEAAKEAARGISELGSLAEEGKDREEKPQESEPSEDETPDEKLRRSALSKLEEAGKPSALGQGLKAFDDSMETIATGAFQAIGNAWKGSVNIVQKLETQAEQFAGTIHADELTAKASILAPKLLQSGKELTAKGLKALEYVGKETLDILSLDELERRMTQRSGEENLMEDATFDRCFYIYGGPEHLEELEALANHYMLLCNRGKAKMSSERRSMFDGLLKQLPELLSLDNEDTSPGSDKGKQIENGSGGDGKEVKSLRESSVSKAAEMATSFTATIGGLPLSDVVQKTSDRLEAIKAEGVHRISELCAVCVAHLLTLGKSMVASNAEDKAQDADNFVWPEDCLGKATFIRGRARDMANDIEAVSDSFSTGIGDVAAAFQAAMKSDDVIRDEVQAAPVRVGVVEDKAQALSSDIRNDGNAAIERLQDGLQQLVYVVLSTSLKNK